MAQGMSKGKARRSAKNARSGKYRLQFLKTVKKCGRWRGRKKSVLDLKSGPASLSGSSKSRA